MLRAPFPILVAAALLAACQPRMPLSRVEASAAARNWCLRDGLAWGDPIGVEGPSAPDAAGRRWWIVRFAGPERVLWVNVDSGWVKRAPPSEAPPASPEPPSAPSDPPSPPK
ncbi:MAG: hypothetical protein RMM29_03170 [Planctomycetota bacterium]|nr:hypothetical protein [Planctomycetota bacterium]MCX8039257.1 hypothetical protein [Planctomycetota bacterium]MDW8372633.1 hypothetical protein [Planctomycetota bacterium]